MKYNIVKNIFHFSTAHQCSGSTHLVVSSQWPNSVPLPPYQLWAGDWHWCHGRCKWVQLIPSLLHVRLGINCWDWFDRLCDDVFVYITASSLSFGLSFTTSETVMGMFFSFSKRWQTKWQMWENYQQINQEWKQFVFCQSKHPLKMDHHRFAVEVCFIF